MAAAPYRYNQLQVNQLNQLNHHPATTHGHHGPMNMVDYFHSCKSKLLNNLNTVSMTLHNITTHFWHFCDVNLKIIFFLFSQSMNPSLILNDRK